jgi:hypothetical protein
MTSFGYPIHNKKLKNIRDNILELKVHFESKLISIKRLNEKVG